MNTDTQIPPEAPTMRLASLAVWVVAAALLAATLKLCIPLNTEGTNDVPSFHQFASDLDFFAFAPGVGAEYLVWQMAFLLVLSPAAFAYVTAACSVFMFFMYNTIASGLPWNLAVSKPEIADRWAPWLIWPWLAFVAALTTEWLRTRRRNPSTRLLNLKSSGDSNP